MKFKSICLTVLFAVGITACSDKKADDNIVAGTENDAAYISLKVLTPSGSGTRASAETVASDTENAIKTLKAVVFNSNYQVIKHSTVSDAVQSVTGFGSTGQNTTENTNAFKVPGNARYLLIIANPGTLYNAVLGGITAGMHFNNLNNAITAASAAAAAAEISNATAGYTMVNMGLGVADDNDVTSAAELCLIDLAGKVQVVGAGDGQYETAAEAQAAAETAANRVAVKIERLTSKVEVVEKAGGATVPADVTFSFTSWVLDVVNKSFYPWAKKVDLASVPSNSNFYTKNFYSIDPNYDNNIGIEYNPVTVTFPATADIDKPAYCVENTTKAGEQDNDKITRVVVKATYYPNNWTAPADWYAYGNNTYETLELMQAAYSDDTPPIDFNLRNACDRFFQKVKASDGTNIAATNFVGLTQAMLNAMGIANGGELVKENDCILWYQKGLCYYFFAIRHDDAVTDNNAFAKYGLVRNNWYQCTINSVSEAGTPWYPDVDDDPIDETEGYISATINIGPWVKWAHDVDL